MCHSWRALEHQKKEPWPHRDPAGLFFCDGNDRLRIRVGMLSVAPCAPCTWFSGLPHTTSADPKSPVPLSGALCFPRNGHLFKPFQNSGCRRRAPNERRTNRGGKDRWAPRSQSHGRGAAAIRLSSASSVGYRLPIGRRLGRTEGQQPTDGLPPFFVLAGYVRRATGRRSTIGTVLPSAPHPPRPTQDVKSPVPPERGSLLLRA